MADRPLTTPLTADLPENWRLGQIVAPQGADAGLSEQHGYNYLMAAVNAAIRAINALNEGFDGAAGSEDIGVSSFNGRTGAITPQTGDYTAAQVGARPDTWTPTAEQVGARPAGWMPTPSEIGTVPITYGTADLTAGTSSLVTGTVYLVYE